MMPLKLILILSIFISVPFILYEEWGFIAPVFYKNERRLMLPLLISRTWLFYVGVAFAYFIVFPSEFDFFL